MKSTRVIRVMLALVLAMLAGGLSRHALIPVAADAVSPNASTAHTLRPHSTLTQRNVSWASLSAALAPVLGHTLHHAAVTQDTLQQQAELTASNAKTGDDFGISVALSGDGNTTLVGAYGTNQGTGAAYVFVRSGSSWIQQAELTASDGVPGDLFGGSAVLSGDGNTALVGASAYGKNSSAGAAYVFVRSGNSWSQQQELTASDGAASDYFGDSVALSGDGSVALVGAHGKGSYTGAAYVFVRSGNSWSQQVELTASIPVSSASFGHSVALSGDGNTALVGAFGTNYPYTGAAYVFVRSGSTWSQQAELTASDGARDDSFGYSVALSSDGSTALIGAEGKNNNTGAAYIYVRSGNSWSQQAELSASDGVPGDEFGFSVALSDDGITALVGIYKNGSAGAAYVFVRSGSTWSQQAKLTAADAADGDQFGYSVALSSDGSTALIGAYRKNTATGAAYVFAADTVPPTTTAALSPAPTLAGWNNSTVTVTLSAVDNPGGSGVAVTYYAVDNAACAPGALGSCLTYTSPFTIPSQGQHTVYYFSVDNAGNVETQQKVPVNIDETPPQTMVGFTGLATGHGSYFVPVTVTLAATDTLSGIATTAYQLDGGASQPYVGPFTLAVTGTHTITVSSTDNVGNVEAPHAASVTLVAPALSISPAQGSTKQTVTLSGANFAAGERVQIYGDRVGSTPIYSATAATDGSFVITRRVLPGPYGPHTIIAVGQSSGQAASAPFFITPATVLRPSLGHQGARITLSGTGFAANERVIASYWEPGTIVLGSATANAEGSVALAFTVPIRPAGVYTVVAVGQASHAVASSRFSVTPALSVAPSSGQAGRRVLVGGAGYGAQEMVTVRWDCASSTCGSTTVIGRVRTDANGDFAASGMTIPATAPIGMHTLGGVGTTSRAFAATVFTVTP